MSAIGLGWLGVTVLDPYLLPWALRQGIPAAQAGAIFAMQPFAVVFVQPFVSRLGKAFGYAPLLVVGLAVSGFALLCFAGAPGVAAGNSLTLFAVLCFAALIAGLGEGVVDTCTFVLVSEAFPDVLGQMTGHTEAWIGIGTVLGPLVGGLLYAVGGFMVPTAVTGMMLCILSVGCRAWSRRYAKDGPRTSCLQEALCQESYSAQNKDEHGIRLPDAVVFITVVLGNVFSGIVSGTYAPLTSAYYVGSYCWSESVVGTVFCAFGFMYMAGAVLAGWLCDYGPCTARSVFTIGFFVCAVAMVFIPLPWPGMSVSGVMLLGAGTSLLIVPVFSLLEQSASVGSDGGFLAAVLNASFSFGVGAGPLVTVPLGDVLGFQPTMLLVSVASLLLGAWSTFAMVWRPLPAAGSQ